jgi:hypothetical protein
LRADARDFPFFFGISFSGVGGPAKAPRRIAANRSVVSCLEKPSEFLAMALSRSKAFEELQRQAKTIPDQMEIISQVHSFEAQIRMGADHVTTASLVLRAAGLLEHALGEAIASRLVIKTKIAKQKIFEGDHEREGIIGTIYTRNVIAHALDIYGDKTFDDVNTVRVVRNLCAHAKTQPDFGSEAIKAVCQFHSVGVLERAFSEPMPGPTSPVHGLMEFVQYFVPYLLLHTSTTWVPQNKLEWRAIFS